MRVLFVDDDELVCEFLATISDQLGIEHETARTTEAALAYCEQKEVALTVTDLQMVNIDGLKLAQELRRRYPEMGMFAFTGESSAYSLKLLDETFDKVYFKPTEYSAMIAEAMRFLAVKKYPFLG